ncbi:glycosyl transferase family, a/b domain-containing protein [Dipodascopsis tothii]|uniref:glycosyl transferase family, a/b domain-containing protein n=1 Tax=Dipodascopsis tothii TaxID=44089 RepID=UPI0034CF25CD
MFRVTVSLTPAAAAEHGSPLSPAFSMATPLTPYLRALTASPPTLSAADVRQCLLSIFTGDVPDVQTAAFLTLIRAHGFDRDPEIVAAAAETMRGLSRRVEVADGPYVDVVGTGGDGQNTFNVSTSAGLVAAGMGLRVCKHGNKASTSTSGAADLLSSLGASIGAVNPATLPAVLESSAFCFIFAPVFHPIMGKIAPLRRALGVPSIFNILGPLLNPVQTAYRIIGINVPELGPVFARALLMLDRANGRASSTMIVWGEEGLDEISPAGRTRFWRIQPGSDDVVEGFLDPVADFGLPRHELSTVASGTPGENALKLNSLLRGALPDGDPIKDYVVMNAAALSVIAGQSATWVEGVSRARDAISSGAALRATEDYVRATVAAEAAATS